MQQLAVPLAAFLTGSILTLALPLGVLIVVALWYLYLLRGGAGERCPPAPQARAGSVVGVRQPRGHAFVAGAARDASMRAAQAPSVPGDTGAVRGQFCGAGDGECEASHQRHVEKHVEDDDRCESHARSVPHEPQVKLRIALELSQALVRVVAHSRAGAQR
ncbi:MAG: hypothetical protein ACYDHT_05560 [Solirubrobacteraceae bacterium]